MVGALRKIENAFDDLANAAAEPIPTSLKTNILVRAYRKQ